MERSRSREEGFGGFERLLSCADELPYLDFFTNKHRALYLYIQRILMPIWTLNVTNVPKSSKLAD